jgi:hypothetical protein
MADSGEDEEVGAGEGYARYALSESDDNAHTAAESVRGWVEESAERTYHLDWVQFQ